MKTKYSEIAVKIFLVVVTVILVGLLIAWSTGVFKEKRNGLNDGTERINNALSSLAEFDLLYYDGTSITGSLLLDLIKEKADGSSRLDGVEIVYKTLSEPTATPSPYPSPAPVKGAPRYINPNGIFEGKVVRGSNNAIERLEFAQHK